MAKHLNQKLYFSVFKRLGRCMQLKAILFMQAISLYAFFLVQKVNYHKHYSL